MVPWKTFNETRWNHWKTTKTPNECIPSSLQENLHLSDLVLRVPCYLLIKSNRGHVMVDILAECWSRVDSCGMNPRETCQWRIPHVLCRGIAVLAAGFCGSTFPERIIAANHGRSTETMVVGYPIKTNDKNKCHRWEVSSLNHAKTMLKTPGMFSKPRQRDQHSSVAGTVRFLRREHTRKQPHKWRNYILHQSSIYIYIWLCIVKCCAYVNNMYMHICMYIYNYVYIHT